MKTPQQLKQIISDRLIQKEVQLMRAEENEIKQEVIRYLYAGVKELRYLYKLLFLKEMR